MQNIHWYPGHMAKAFRTIENHLKLVDACIELRDARIPLSSANPKIDELVKNKPRLILLNKSDLADSAALTAWIGYFESKGIIAIPSDAVSGKGIKQLHTALRKITSAKKQQLAGKGIRMFSMRAMILGIPNVGKSTLINTINKSKVAKTADRAGVTRGVQWIKVADDLELLDFPGVLWPKIDDQQSAQYLAFTGCINDDAIDKQALAAELALFLHTRYHEKLVNRYSTDTGKINDNIDGYSVLEAIAVKRGFLLSGGKADINRAGGMLLNEFRNGKLGKFTLDLLPDNERV